MRSCSKLGKDGVMSRCHKPETFHIHTICYSKLTTLQTLKSSQTFSISLLKRWWYRCRRYDANACSRKIGNPSSHSKDPITFQLSRLPRASTRRHQRCLLNGAGAGKNATVRQRRVTIAISQGRCRRSAAVCVLLRLEGKWEWVVLLLLL